MKLGDGITRHKKQVEAGERLLACLSGFLFTQTEFLNDRTIAVDVFLHQVVEKVAAMTDHFEQATTGVVVFLMLFQVLGQVVDAASQNRDLDFGRTRVTLVGGVLLHNFGFFVG
jgi:hypothetical protein